MLVVVQYYEYTSESYTLKGWISYNLDYISIKLSFKKKNCPECQTELLAGYVLQTQSLDMGQESHNSTRFYNPVRF